MTPESLSRLQSFGLTVERFAELTGIYRSTVYGWGKTRSGRDVQPEPGWVRLLLDAWERCPEAMNEP